MQELLEYRLSERLEEEQLELPGQMVERLVGRRKDCHCGRANCSAILLVTPINSVGEANALQSGSLKIDTGGESDVPY